MKYIVYLWRINFSAIFIFIAEIKKFKFMKYNLKKLLQKCLKKKVEYVLLKEGVNNNCDLDSLEINLLQDLVIELNTSDLVITFDDVAVTPYITSYNGGDALAGLKFNKLER